MLTATQRATRQRLRRFLLRVGERLAPMGCRVEKITLPDQGESTDGTLHLILLTARGGRFEPFLGSPETIRVRLRYMALGGPDRNAAAMGLDWEAEVQSHRMPPMKGLLGTTGGVTPERAILLAAAFNPHIDAPDTQQTVGVWDDGTGKSRHTVLAPVI